MAQTDRSVRAVLPSQSRPAHYQPLVVVFAAVAGGMMLDRWAGDAQFAPQICSLRGAALWWLASAYAWLAWLLMAFARLPRAASVMLCVALASVGGCWHHVCWSSFDQIDIGMFAREEPQPAAIVARVRSAPRLVNSPGQDPLRGMMLDDRTRFEVDVLAIRDRQTWTAARGQALIYVTGTLTDLAVGDQVRLFGRLERFAPASNPGGFDLARYRRGSRLLATVACELPGCIETLGRPTWAPLAHAVDRLRQRGDDLLWAHLPPPQSSLAAALFLGSREELDAARTQPFIRTGTIHLLAVSGMHVVMLIGGVWWLLRVLQIRGRAALVIVALVAGVYTLLTDAQAPIVRASVMLLVVLGGIWLRRPAGGWNALAAGGLVIVAINPADLFRAGPQLSFLCVAVLVAVTPRLLLRPPTDPLERLIYRTRPWHVRVARELGRRAVELTLISAAIWLVTLPLVAYHFHLCPLVAIPLNTLLWPVIGLAMASGFALLCLGWIGAWIGAPLAAVCGSSLSLLEAIVGLADRVPMGHYWVAGPSLTWIAGWYAMLAVLAACWSQRRLRRGLLAALAVWIVTGWAWSLVPHYPSSCRCTFLDVGHGLAVVIESPKGEVYLYDAGQLGSPERAATAVSGYLWSQGHRRINAVVISHADVDHYNAIPELLDRFAVDAIYTGPHMFDDPGPAPEALRRAIAHRRVPWETIAAGDQLSDHSQLTLHVLQPPADGGEGSDNARSVVLDVGASGRHVLLTGDLEESGVTRLLASSPPDCDVLLAPHHGSLGSEPTAVARWCRPQWVVVSGDPHDRSAALARAYGGVPHMPLTTATSGAVQVTMAADALTVRVFRRSPTE